MRLDDFFGIVGLLIVFAGIAGWFTHIVWSITTLLGETAMTVNQGVIAIVGAFAPPIGAIHGVLLWFS